MRLEMKNNALRNFFISLASLLIILPSPASAEEIPLLVWEQGKVQSVVLGAAEGDDSWSVYLVAGDREFEFRSSMSNSSGYQTFERTIPTTLDEGQYQLLIRGDNSPSPKVVAFIQIIESSTVSTVRIPWQLNTILLLALLNLLYLLQGRNHRHAKFLINRSEDDPKTLLSDNSADSLLLFKSSTFVKYRTLLIEKFSWGLLQSLMRYQDSNLQLLKSKVRIITPFLSTVAALFFYYNMENQDWLAPQFLFPLVLLIILSSIDLFSGVVAFFILIAWSSMTMVFTGQGFLPILSLVVLSSIFLLPAYLILMARELNDNSTYKSILSGEVLKGYFLAISYPFLALLIFNSIQDDPTTQIDLKISFIFSSAIIASSIILELRSKAEESIRRFSLLEEIEIYPGGRHLSSTFIISFFLIVQALVYLWSEDIVQSSSAALIWSLPLLSSRVKINPGWYSRFRLEKINFLAVSIFATFYFSLIYLALLQFPILVSDRAMILILASPLPLYLYAFLLLARETRLALSKGLL